MGRSPRQRLVHNRSQPLHCMRLHADAPQVPEASRSGMDGFLLQSLRLTDREICIRLIVTIRPRQEEKEEAYWVFSI